MNVELILTSYLNDSDVYHDNLLLSAINITCVPYVRGVMITIQVHGRWNKEKPKLLQIKVGNYIL